MISVSNLKKSFGDLVVLDGITETIEKGEKVVVIGPSGSGKSTFLRCLNLLEQPTSGVIEFEGRDITHAKGRELNSVRMKMGMVFMPIRPVGQGIRPRVMAAHAKTRERMGVTMKGISMVKFSIRGMP